MSREPLPLGLARQVTPGALKSYAVGSNWELVEGINGTITVYQRPDSRAHQVIIPVDETLSDYDEAVAEAVRKLAEYEKRSAHDLLQQLLLPPADVFEFGEISPEAE